MAAKTEERDMTWQPELDELRRRAGDQLRPKDELDYIDRLLKTY